MILSEIDSSPESPESRVIPYENFNDLQIAISGESFRNLFWLYAKAVTGPVPCFNIRGLIDICPVCLKDALKIPLTMDETSEISYDNQQGLSIKFTRKYTLEMIPFLFTLISLGRKNSPQFSLTSHTKALSRYFIL